MRNTRDAEQVLRLDGRGVFVEVTTNGLPIDKAFFGFVQYNKNAEKGSRTSGSINIYMNVLEAQVLARDIMSGRLATLKKIELKRMKEKEQRRREREAWEAARGPSIRSRAELPQLPITDRQSPGSSKSPPAPPSRGSFAPSRGRPTRHRRA